MNVCPKCGQVHESDGTVGAGRTIPRTTANMPVLGNPRMQWDSVLVPQEYVVSARAPKLGGFMAFHLTKAGRAQAWKTQCNSAPAWTVAEAYADALTHPMLGMIGCADLIARRQERISALKLAYPTPVNAFLQWTTLLGAPSQPRDHMDLVFPLRYSRFIEMLESSTMVNEPVQTQYDWVGGPGLTSAGGSPEKLEAQLPNPQAKRDVETFFPPATAAPGLNRWFPPTHRR